MQFKISSALCFNLDHSKILLSGNGLKITWEKETLLAMSYFFFSYSVFYPLREFSSIFIKFGIVVGTLFQFGKAEPHSIVGSVADLRTGSLWFDPWLCQYSFRRSMIVIATGFIPLSPWSVVSTMVMWESSRWLGKNIVQSTG